MIKYLDALRSLATKVFDLGVEEGYRLRTHERDLEADGNWSWSPDSRGRVVLRHKGEDCPDETLSELVLFLLEPEVPEKTPATDEPADPDFLR